MQSEPTPQEVQESLKQYVSIPKQKYQEMDHMVQTFEMLRADLLDMGLISDNVPPMFFGEMIAGNVQKLIREQRSQIVEQCARVSSSYDSTPWQHSPAYSHVADMVSIEIANNIRKTLKNG